MAYPDQSPDEFDMQLQTEPLTLGLSTPKLPSRMSLATSFRHVHQLPKCMHNQDRQRRQKACRQRTDAVAPKSVRSSSRELVQVDVHWVASGASEHACLNLPRLDQSNSPQFQRESLHRSPTTGQRQVVPCC